MERKPRIKPEWMPITRLGHLVKSNLVDAQSIFTFGLSIKEPEIAEHLFGDTLKEEVLVVKSVQKQTKAGQRTRIKAVVAVGNENGVIGIGSKTAKEAAIAIRGAIGKAKCNIRPVKRGYWGIKFGEEHTVPVKSHGKCGSVSIRVIPAPKGSGIRAGSVAKRIFMLAGVKDVFTSAQGQTCTNENFVKAAVMALDNATGFYAPDQWAETEAKKHPMIEFSSVLQEMEKKLKIN